jgi:hypothetical protein
MRETYPEGVGLPTARRFWRVFHEDLLFMEGK